MTWLEMDVLAKYVTAHPLCESPKVTFTKQGIIMTRPVARQIAGEVLQNARHLRGNPTAKQVAASRNYLKQFIV
jgi:hypothetical protein